MWKVEQLERKFSIRVDWCLKSNFKYEENVDYSYVALFKPLHEVLIDEMFLNVLCETKRVCKSHFGQSS